MASLAIGLVVVLKLWDLFKKYTLGSHLGTLLGPQVILKQAQFRESLV